MGALSEFYELSSFTFVLSRLGSTQAAASKKKLRPFQLYLQMKKEESEKGITPRTQSSRAVSRIDANRRWMGENGVRRIGGALTASFGARARSVERSRV